MCADAVDAVISHTLTGGLQQKFLIVADGFGRAISVWVQG